MKLRLEDKNLAIKLRRQGKTYSEIRTIIPNLPKSTLSGWLKNVKLSEKEEKYLQQRLKEKLGEARMKSVLTKRKKRQKRIKRIQKEAGKEYLSLSRNSLFKLGLVLYWAEGTRKYEIFQFSNSDPYIVKIIMKWLTKVCRVPKENIKLRVFIHKIYAQENCEKFWSKITKIPVSKFQKTIYKPTPHKFKKNPKYKGCVQIRVTKTEFFWKVMQWIKELIKEYRLS